MLVKFYLGMGEPSLLTPWKKRKTENEYSLRLICQEQSTVKVIKNSNSESLKKLLSLSFDRSRDNDNNVLSDSLFGFFITFTVWR